MSEKIDYKRTVELRKLVLQDRKLPTLHTKLVFIILISIGGVFIYELIRGQLKVPTPSISDYLVVFIAPIIYVFASIIIFKTLVSRNRLKEIQITLHRDEAKQKILKAASDLSWSLFMTSNNYFRFYTKSSFVNDMQTITIIFFPDNKVYFNSLNYPDDDSKPARFEQNYTALIEKLKYHKC
jgi:hypothetical protein